MMIWTEAGALNFLERYTDFDRAMILTGSTVSFARMDVFNITHFHGNDKGSDQLQSSRFPENKMKTISTELL